MKQKMFLAVAFLALAATVRATNLFSNGNFSNGTSGWSSVGGSVEVNYRTTYTSTYPSCPSYMSSSSYICELQSDDWSTVYQAITIPAGARYEVSCFHGGRENAGDVQVMSIGCIWSDEGVSLSHANFKAHAMPLVKISGAGSVDGILASVNEDQWSHIATVVENNTSSSRTAYIGFSAVSGGSSSGYGNLIAYAYVGQQVNAFTYQPLLNGLVAWYKFDGNANDSSGNGNHGTNNGVTPTTDRFGNANGAYQFNGYRERDYIQVSSSTSLNSIGSATTISAWVRPDAIEYANGSRYTDGLEWIVSLVYKGNAYVRQYSLQIENNSSYRWLYGPGTISGASPRPTVGIWQLVTLTDNGSTLTAYINGAVVGTGTRTTSSSSTSYPLYIGFDPGGEDDYFNGAMDDLRIYNRALSAAEVAALYSGTTVTYAGFIPTTKVKLCSGGSALDIVGATGYFCSRSVNAPGDVSACNFKVNGTTVTAQFQKADDRYTKCLGVEFTTESDGVYARAVYSRYRDGTTHVGEDFDTGSYSSNTPVTSEYSSNGYGIKNLRVQMVAGAVEPTPSPLATALNTTQTVTTGGDANWFVQASETHDGVSAAQSGAIPDTGGSSYFETSVTGPAKVSFWWKVDSEDEWDWLTLKVDGTTQYSISGNADDGYYFQLTDSSTRDTTTYTGGWQQREISVDSGTHTIRWEYSKDGSRHEGSDCGWVDQLVVSSSANGVTFGKNGGTGGDDGLTVVAGATPADVTPPTRTGYTFGGYWTSVGASGEMYFDGSGRAVRAWDLAVTGVKLWAKWSAITCVATFDKQGGTGGDLRVTVNYDATPHAVTVPSRTGYTFAGYWTSTSGGTKYFNADGSAARTWKIGSTTTTLYARWTGNAYRLTFGKNAGTGGDDYVTATYQATPHDIRIPTRTGYTFGGYWTSTGASGVRYFDGAGKACRVWDKPSAATLWALWTRATYTLTFGKNGGAGGDESVSVQYGAMPRTITVPTRTGYSFGGYWTSTGTSGVQYYAADGRATRVWDKGASATLWAKWIGKTYTVTFGKNGGTGGDDRKTVTFGSKASSVNIPRKGDASFAGYWTSTGSSGVQYFGADGSATRVWDKTQDITLWAKWSNAITFSKNGGSGGDARVTAYHAEIPHAITPPTRAGWIFDGYWTSLPGGSEIYFADGAATGKWTGTANLTLVAKWTQGTAYQVTFDKRGGTGGGAYVRVARGVAMPRIVLPTRTGYTFAGYWTTPSGEGVQYYRADGTSARNWNAAKGGTLYARWVEK